MALRLTPDTTVRIERAELARLREVAEVAVEAVKNLQWCMDNLGAGVEWGGPFDDAHKQGMYHCTHCDARFKPGAEEDGEPSHKADCPLQQIEPLLERAARAGIGKG